MERHILVLCGHQVVSGKEIFDKRLLGHVEDARLVIVVYSDPEEEVDGSQIVDLEMVVKEGS